MKITSRAFQDGSSIPSKYTADGADMSPPLAWSDPPDGTRSFALICDDPDAPGRIWVHWVVYNVPPARRELAEGVKPQEALPDGTRQGLTDFMKVGYGGPAPPRGTTHRYFFKLYALDAMLDPGPRATKSKLLDAMRGHIQAEAQLVGLYSR